MTRVSGQAVRARLVDAAEEAMRDVGPLALRIDDVAQRAGCSRATVYRHVADKDELVREVLVRQARRLADRLERDLSLLADPADAVAEGVLRTVDAVQREWWYRALEGHGATAAVARIGGGPRQFSPRWRRRSSPASSPGWRRKARCGRTSPRRRRPSGSWW